MEKGDKQFIYYWHKEFGWKSDPFDKKFIFPISNFISGYEKERRKLNYFVIDKLPLVTISGDDGYGKTSLLLWLKEELNNYKGVLIVDYVSKEINFVKFIKTLLEPILSVKERLAGFSSKISEKSLKLIEDKNLYSIYEALYFKKVELDLVKVKSLLAERLKNRPLVLIIDDLSSIDEKIVVLVKLLIDSDINIQVAIAGNDNIDKIGKKEHVKLHIDGLSFDECKEMIEKRILNVKGNGFEPFDENILSDLYKKCNKNPLIFMNLCREKAVTIALNNLNLKKVKVIQGKNLEKKEEQNKNNEERDRPEDLNGKKHYEIKVLNPKPSEAYKIVVDKPKKRNISSKKIDKNKNPPKRIK